jgi:hypothetical protein
MIAAEKPETDAPEHKASTSDPPGRLSWLRSAHPQILAGAIGAFGAVLGAGATGYVQLLVEKQRDVQAEMQRRRDRAEEIVTLIEKTPETYIAERKAMELEPSHMALPSTDAMRVTALVALYFPDANEAARAYEDACANQSAMLSDSAVAVVVRHTAPPDDRAIFQRMLVAGDILTEKVLADVGVSYQRRAPVDPLTIPK